MKHSPALALLIPAYNAAEYLPRLLHSAAQQSVPFDEVWVYDDCSTDNTAEVAENLGARVVRGDRNRGCSCGKNVLAARTNADWVHFHDADDELYPSFVSLARKWMMDNWFDVILFPYEERDSDSGNRIGFRRFDPTDVARDARSYAVREQINPFNGLYRRDAFLRAGGYDEDPRVLFNEDVAMHIRLAFAGLSFAAETEVSIINHRRANSMSGMNRLKCLQAQFQVMRMTSQRPGADKYAVEIAEKLWNIVAGLASQLDWKTADDAARLAVKLAGLSRLPHGSLFRRMCRLSPSGAIRFREALIRTFKPEVRRGYPGWRMTIARFEH